MIPTLRSSALLDRQSGKRSDPEYLAALGRDLDARFIVLLDHKPVIVSNEARTEAALRWFTLAEIEKADLNLQLSELLFLGVEREGGAGRFAVVVSELDMRHSKAALEMFRPAVDLRSLAMQGIMSSEEVSLAGKAKGLAHWHDNARCCGRCGAVTRIRDGGWRRRCWACGTDIFPRTDPVVIMLVEHPDRKSCLLGRSARFAPNMYSTLAGFIEPGEDVADAVRREVMEEAGIEVDAVSYHSTQPWPFPHSLMIGCIAQATTTELTIDLDELADARWFTRDECRHMIAGTHKDGLTGPGRQAIARALMDAFVEGRT
jgi:NAD+ diphosphatase